MGPGSRRAGSPVGPTVGGTRATIPIVGAAARPGVGRRGGGPRLPRVHTLAVTPGRIVDADGRLRRGLTEGPLREDPLAVGPRTGRARRWSYAAAASPDLALGAAIVELGFVAAAFVWCRTGSGLHTWQRRSPLGLGVSVGSVPDTPARSTRGGSVVIGPGGSLRIDVPTDAGRLVAGLDADGGSPVTLITGTPAGGWNATEKAAGYAVAGGLSLGGVEHVLDGGGWRDWTAGRQDRRTRWRWAAGAGRTTSGSAVGLNVSTGMNATEDGEDVVWWDGQPAALPVDVLEPVDRPDGGWRLAGRGWALDFHTEEVRAADERLLLMESRYVQPVGRFTGTLPGPDGVPVPVELQGVTEIHEARW